MHVGPHPNVFYATHLANALRAKLRHVAVIGSYGWGSKAAERIAGLIPNLKVELLGSVFSRGYPKPEDFAALDQLAERIREKHSQL